MNHCKSDEPLLDQQDHHKGTRALRCCCSSSIHHHKGTRALRCCCSAHSAPSHRSKCVHWGAATFAISGRADAPFLVLRALAQAAMDANAIAKLKELAELKAGGLITEEGFAQQKAALMSGGSANRNQVAPAPVAPQVAAVAAKRPVAMSTEKTVFKFQNFCYDCCTRGGHQQVTLKDTHIEVEQTVPCFWPLFLPCFWPFICLSGGALIQGAINVTSRTKVPYTSVTGVYHDVGPTFCWCGEGHSIVISGVTDRPFRIVGTPPGWITPLSEEDATLLEDAVESKMGAVAWRMSSSLSA